jgi:uncharacterized membrane protein
MAGVNMDSNERRLLLVFAYLLTWLSGVIVLFINDGRDQNLKFHSLQAIFLGILITVIWMGSFLLIPPVRIIDYLMDFLLYLYGLYVGIQAYSGRSISMPVIGTLAGR